MKSKPAFFEERPYVTPYRCRKCLSLHEQRWRRCPTCGGRYTVVPAGAESSRRSDRTIEPVSSLDAVVTEEPRFSTGFPEIDTVFGGGIRVGSVNLLRGRGGLGKTTLLMQIAKRTPVKSVLLIQSEQPQSMVMSTAARVHATRRDFKIIANDDVDVASRLIEQGSYELVIVDSLQGLSDSSIDAGPSSIKVGRRIGKKLTSLAHHRGITMIITNHVTLAGSEVGGTYNVHGVDATFELTGNPKDPTGYRELWSEKNRFGPSGLRAFMRITDTGMKILTSPSTTPAPPAETSKRDDGQRQDRERPGATGARARRRAKDGAA